jgi:hypothetical protein
MTNIRSLVDNITANDNVSASQKIADIMAEKLEALLDLAKIEVAQGMFNTCEECEEPVLTQEQYDALSEEEKADYEELDEALKGNQHKIDANKNGKLDAQDFKMLRAKKGMKEENEVEEAYTDPYAAKKAAEMKKAHSSIMADAKKEFDAAKKTKFAKNFMKLKKEEVNLDEKLEEEINTKSSEEREREKVARFAKQARNKLVKDMKSDLKSKAITHDDNTLDAYNRTIKKVIKLNNTLKKAQEEVEQIDELKASTLGNYVSKAAVNMSASNMKGDMKKTMKRAAGINKAAKKMKEEVEQIYEISQFKKNEIAHELRHEDEAMEREAAKKRKYAPSKQEPHAVHIGGKKWKSFGSQAHASAVAKKLEAKGKKATVHKEEVQIDEVITKKTPTGEVISDFVHSKNPMFKGKSKKERIRMALGAKYAMMKKGK